MLTTTLEEVIRNHVRLGRPNGQGWHSVVCPCDHGRKGPRAAFKFENGVVGYNCFNCGLAAVFNPLENKSMPKKMQLVLEQFKIPKEDWQGVLFAALAAGEQPTIVKQQVDIEPKEIEFPDFFYPLAGNDNDEWDVCAREYLAFERAINYKDHTFYLSKRTIDPKSKQWYGRLIIPFYKDKKLIFYQGRDVSTQRVKKYLSPDVARENVLYGYEFITEDNDAPLFIVEGWFDAFLLKGVAVLGDRMTPNQVKWINQSRRKKVVVPDRYGDGWRLAEQALELGWSVSTPDTPGCKDVTDAVVKYGMLYTLSAIKEGTHEGFAAATRVMVYCQRGKANEM